MLNTYKMFASKWSCSLYLGQDGADIDMRTSHPPKPSRASLFTINPSKASNNLNCPHSILRCGISEGVSLPSIR